MKTTRGSKRQEARRLYLTGEAMTNREIAAQLKVKPHTVGRWRRLEDWDAVRVKIDRRTAEMFAERIASDRIAMNEHHYKLWAVVLARLAESLKNHRAPELREMERVTAIVERSQRGQRLARGMSIGGETEEVIRAQAELEIRRLVDAFTDAVKENVTDEETRDRIRQVVLSSLRAEEDDGAGGGEDSRRE